MTFVPTPLGNLRDITLRALDVLRESDLIVAEDTRVTRCLLSAHGIAGKPLLSYREQNAGAVTAAILARAKIERVAVVSDAGMPAVSDPGRELLVVARAAGINVEVLPGPVAFITAAALSGFPTTALIFEGYVPRAKRERENVLRRALDRGIASAWYEAPARIVATLESLHAIEPACTVFVARELTKVYEQQALGTPTEVLAALERPVRGEIVLVLGPRPGTGGAPPAVLDLDAAIDAALEAGLSAAAAAKSLAKRGAGPRDRIYSRINARKQERR